MAQDSDPENECKAEEKNFSELRETSPRCGAKRNLGAKESLYEWCERKEKRRLEGNRKTPDGRKALRRTGALKKTKLNAVSKKQKKRNQEYKHARELHYSIEANRMCALCSRTDHLSIHHVSKRGANLSDHTKFVTLCLVGSYMDEKYPESNHSHQGGCHAWIEANKTWARENGYLE